LAPSKAIIHRIRKRHLYKFVDEFLVPPKVREHLKIRPADIITHQSDCTEYELRENDVIVDSFVVNYAMKDKNPVDHVRFFRKGNHTQAFTIPKEDVSLLIPLHFSENYIRIYARDPKKVVICIVFGIIYPRERLINL